jgi:ABC-2 type transport system permease protein
MTASVPIIQNAAHVLTLLSPRWWALRNAFLFGGRRVLVKAGALLAMTIGFWVGIYVVFFRVLSYFQAVEEFGHILAYKLLSMVFLTFFGLLIFSNVIVTLSTFFLGRDLTTIHATPVSLGEFFTARFLETMLESSWMVLLFGIPIFTAYGLIYHAKASYYLGLFSVTVPYLMLAAALGVSITMLLVQIFPAQRTRDILFLLSVLLVILLYFLFRFMRPERLVDPDAFSSVVLYFRALSTPSSRYLPSTWAAEAIWPLLRPSFTSSAFYQGFLWMTALASVVVSVFVAFLVYPQGWSKSQETRRMKVGRILSRIFPGKTLRKRQSSQVMALIGKDFRTFFRDSTQWSQLLLVVALIVVYLYNYSVLPFDRAPMPTFYFQNLIAFLNIGLAGFVLAAVGARFVFPAVSGEGYSFWIMQSAPVSPKRLLWSKFFFYLGPLLLLGQILTILSNELLQVAPLMRWLAPITVFCMVFGITALGIGTGAAHPNFKAENLAQVATGFGGLLYMILAMSFIVLVVVLEAGPVYTLFMAQVHQHPLSLFQWSYIAGSLLLAVLVNVAAVWLPMRHGIAKLAAYED